MELKNNLLLLSEFNKLEVLQVSVTEKEVYWQTEIKTQIESCNSLLSETQQNFENRLKNKSKECIKVFFYNIN